jgi:hypothetical protein
LAHTQRRCRPKTMPKPKFRRAPLTALCPTQLTVGMLEVEVKRKHLAALSPEDLEAFLEAHPMPVVIGPAGKLYITDHHHLARAALAAKIDQACFEVEADFSSLKLDDFWVRMDKNSWVHPLDQHGVRHRYYCIPGRLDQMVDDPYRSLAGFVRDAGGFVKTHGAFIEFIWADYFRRNIAIEDVEADFPKAVRQAKRLAKKPLAKRIPGYKG